MKSFNNTVNIIKEIQLELFDLFEGNEQFGFHFYLFKTDLENLTDIVSENLKRDLGGGEEIGNEAKSLTDFLNQYNLESS
jgi:hypothetical protein